MTEYDRLTAKVKDTLGAWTSYRDEHSIDDTMKMGSDERALLRAFNGAVANLKALEDKLDKTCRCGNPIPNDREWCFSCMYPGKPF